MSYSKLKDKSFKDRELGIALLKVNTTDCHVGVYWNYKGVISLFHFVASNEIKIEDATKKYKYRFESIDSFNPIYIPTLIALAPKIVKNKLNLFRTAVKFDGFKFDLSSGTYITPNKEGNHLNCAAFTLALLGTFNMNLLNWKTWPIVSIPKDVMESWMNHHKLDISNADSYRQENREIRGKQVGASALSDSHPLSLPEVKELEKVLDKILK